MNAPSRTANAITNPGVVRSVRRAFVFRGRGAVSAGDGRSVPALRSRGAAVALAIAALALLAFAPIAGAKTVVTGYASKTGLRGGEFGKAPGHGNDIPGLAVNASGAGGVAAGTFYALHNSGGQSRVQRFSPTGAFERAWGWNVQGVNEQQELALQNVITKEVPEGGGQTNGGTFTLTYDGSTTAPIEVWRKRNQEPRPLPEDILNALLALPSLNPGDISVERKGFGGTVFVIEFRGPLAGLDVGQITVDGSQLISDNPLGNPSAVVTTSQQGAGGAGEGFEICTVASQCNRGEGGPSSANGGAMQANGLALSQATGHVYVSDWGKARIQEFDANGNFVRAWGWDVIVSGAPNDTGTGFEICDTTTLNVNTDCKNGVGGSSGGQLSSFGFEHPTIDAAGNVWIPETSNRRIQEFDANGNFVAVYGFNVNNGGVLEKCTSTVAGTCKAGTAGSVPGQFNFQSPTSLAFDSSGNLFAADPSNQRIQKFDPALTSAANFGGSTIASFTNPGGEFPTASPDTIASSEAGTGILVIVRNNVFFSDPANPEQQILELDPADGSLEDTSLVNSRIQSVDEVGFNNGIASVTWDGTAGDVLAATLNNRSPKAILRLSSVPLPDPGITIDPVTIKTDTTATFSGPVDPKGGWVRCAFEYSVDEVTWSSVSVPACESLALGGGAQAVSANASGLEPNTHYFVRLVVSRPLVPGAPKFAATQFDTSAVVPVLTEIGAIEIGDTSARLVGTVDPRKSPTEYVFEYGPTPSLGSSTPPASAGDGDEPVVVHQLIEGLSPGTTYHFRLVATNGAGPAPSPIQTFETREDPIPPPSNRAWEQVSPPDKNGAGALSGRGTAIPALNGEAVQFKTDALFGDPPGQAAPAQADYVARRTATGWKTEAVGTGYCRVDFTDTVGVPAPFPLFMYSPNLDWLVYTWPEHENCVFPPLHPDALLPASNLYRVNLESSPRTYDLLAPERGHPNPVLETFALPGGVPVDASEDFSHVLYNSGGQQTPDAPLAKLEPGASGVYRGHVFEWDNGTLRLVSKDKNGNVYVDGANGFDISADGSRIFFQTPSWSEGGCPPAEPCDIYMRENASQTHDISESECTTACRPLTRSDNFQQANEDGSRVLFTSVDKLTDDGSSNSEGNNLFMYTHSADPENDDDNLTLITRDEEPADGPGVAFLGLVGASDDLETLFFAGEGQIVAGASTAPGPKLYRWRWNGGSPVTEFLASLKSPQSFPNFTPGDASQWGGFSPHKATPDGQYLMLESFQRLEPVADHDATRDVYRWDGAGGWLCISCQLPGEPSNGHSFGPTGPNFGTEPGVGSGIGITDDGQTMFFLTGDQIGPADVNEDLRDVYEWHEGRVQMISSGSDDEHSSLIGTTPTGRDVIFHTEARLVGWDSDRVGDLYDARIDGGFPEPPPPGNLCEGEACRDAGTVPPDTNGAGSAVFEGPKNSPKLTKCPRGTRKVTVKNREVCKKKRARKHRKAKNKDRRRNANGDRRAGK